LPGRAGAVTARRREDPIKVLLVGTGGVGEAIAIATKGRPFLERMVLADYDLGRAREVQTKVGDEARYPVERIDASDGEQVVRLARAHGVDLVMNAVAPNFNESIFDAAFEAGVSYMDMALTLGTRHPTDPYRLADVKLGDYQFERSAAWEEKGLLALVGMGVDPGLSDVFAAYAAKHLFDRIDEIGVRDGSDIQVESYAFAPGFSIWTTIEECLNPPVIYEKDRGWFTTEPFSDPEVFDFPEVGPVECVNVEHEEVLLVPRRLDVGRVTFKYGLGEEFINVLKTLELLGLDSKQPVEVKGVKVAPRDVVAALLPDPAHLGDRMTGKTCVGTWVRGKKDGKPREVFLYQPTDNRESWERYGSQAVVWQTGVNPVIAMELLAEGVWQGAGVLGPEAFDPDPYLERTGVLDYPWGMKEMTPKAGGDLPLRQDRVELLAGLGEHVGSARDLLARAGAGDLHRGRPELEDGLTEARESLGDLTELPRRRAARALPSRLQLNAARVGDRVHALAVALLGGHQTLVFEHLERRVDRPGARAPHPAASLLELPYEVVAVHRPLLEDREQRRPDVSPARPASPRPRRPEPVAGQPSVAHPGRPRRLVMPMVVMVVPVLVHVVHLRSSSSISRRAVAIYRNTSTRPPHTR